jgi:hypothetical protein
MRLPTVSPKEVDLGELQSTEEHNEQSWKVQQINGLDQQGASSLR